jgi:YfiH family protein
VFARQVHGSNVVSLDAGPAALAEDGMPQWVGTADALVTADPELCLAVLGADCGLVALASPEGVIGVAHAGWRGLVAGVLGATVTAMRRAGAGEVLARLGPCIHPCCYAFDPADLDAVLARCPDAVAATTRRGGPALDLPASLARALERAGASVQPSLGGCTACSSTWFSHRARAEPERHALAVFLPAQP